LQGWDKAKGLDAVLNRRGTTWRKLTSAEQAQAETEAGAIALMQANTSLIKRPVLQDGKVLLVGFDADEYRKALAV
jgi:arsenate reductase-like glutaredoxin family protein